MKSISTFWFVLGAVVLGLGWIAVTQFLLPTTSTVSTMDALPPVTSISNGQDITMPISTSSVSVLPPAQVPTPVLRGNFTDTPGHPGAGVAAVYQTDAGQTVRLADFSSTAGPDLFVYLATDIEATNFINLGELKSTQGEQNYTIPDEVKVEEYPYVLIWCKRFGVLFMAATLSDS